MANKYGETVPVRLPDDAAHLLKNLAAFSGVTPAEMMGTAWDSYWQEKGPGIIEAMRQRVDELAVTLSPQSTAAPDNR